ncbi:MAG: hypothetical protein AB7T06_21290 [Kofleriaceae bacterium]
MKTFLAATALLLLGHAVADACAIKDNDVAIVVGVVGPDVATLRISLHEQERDGSMVDSEWSGAATLVIGSTSTPLGTIDPKRDPNLEIDRLTTLALDRAKKLSGFVAATQVDQTDCSETPSDRCGLARLKGTSLRVGRTETTIADDQRITGIVRYRAGDTEIAVVNVGTGNATFATGVRPCNAQGCRTITTLHHGDQRDIVIVTRRGT